MHGLVVEAKLCSLDVRIHHRIWDAQKHLPLALDRQKKKFSDNIIINVTIQQNFFKRLKQLFYPGNTRART